MPTSTAVKASCSMLLIGAILELIAAVIGLSTGIMALSATSAADSDDPVAASLIAFAAVTLIIGVAQLVVLPKVRGGLGWARIAMTAIVVLGLASAILNFGLLPLLASVIGVVALVLLWLPTSNSHFRKG